MLDDMIRVRNFMRKACEDLGYSGRDLEALVIVGGSTVNGTLALGNFYHEYEIEGAKKGQKP